jgi:hypothetical protein
LSRRLSKIAVFAPMPIDSEQTAVAVKPGRLSNRRAL